MWDNFVFIIGYLYIYIHSLDSLTDWDWLIIDWFSYFTVYCHICHSYKPEVYHQSWRQEIYPYKEERIVVEGPVSSSFYGCALNMFGKPPLLPCFDIHISSLNLLFLRVKSSTFRLRRTHINPLVGWLMLVVSYILLVITIIMVKITTFFPKRTF